MGIRFQCPDCGAKLNVKSELAGKRGVCPKCQAKIQIPAESVDAGPVEAPSPAPIAPEPLPQFRTQPAPTPVPTAPAPTGPVQPTAAAAASRWFVRPPSGGQFGPAAEAVLRQWIGEGRITPDTLVWREGDPEWLKASAAFPELTAVPTPPTPLVTGGTVPISAGVTLPKPTELPTPSGELDAASAATAMLMARRKRARATGLLIMGILVIAVLILLPILIYVLLYQSAPPPPAEATAWNVPPMVDGVAGPA